MRCTAVIVYMTPKLPAKYDVCSMNRKQYIVSSIKLTKQEANQRCEPVQVAFNAPSIDLKSTEQKWNSQIQRRQACFWLEYTVLALHLSLIQSIGNDACDQTYQLPIPPVRYKSTVEPDSKL